MRDAFQDAKFEIMVLAAHKYRAKHGHVALRTILEETAGVGALSQITPDQMTPTIAALTAEDDRSISVQAEGEAKQPTQPDWETIRKNAYQRWNVGYRRPDETE